MAKRSRSTKVFGVKMPRRLARALGLPVEAAHYVNRSALDTLNAAKGVIDDTNAAIRAAAREIEIVTPKVRSKTLASASATALRRASPAENVRMGFSPTARRYVKTGAKVTKATASISARQAETKRTRERYGFKTPEAATRARREGGLGYESQAQGERVAKAEQTRLFKRIDAATNAREKIPYDPLGKRNVKRQRWLALKPGDKERYRDLRARRLRGEWFDDIADFTWLMDMSKRFGDRDANRLRGSPDGRLPGEPDFDEGEAA